MRTEGKYDCRRGRLADGRALTIQEATTKVSYAVSILVDFVIVNSRTHCWELIERPNKESEAVM
jgi:hypothetical protein